MDSNGKLVVLELFAGTRSIGKAFERRGHKVYSVDWDKSFDNIDLYADIGTLTKDDVIKLCGGIPDVIHGSPDCFPAGTLIWTDSGYKNVEDIRCFDKVLTHTNIYKPVYATQKTNKRDMYEIKISGCEPVMVSSEHPYYVRRKHRDYSRKSKTYARNILDNPEWVKVSELTTDYKVGIPINTESVIPTWNGCVYAKCNGFGLVSSKIQNTLGKFMDNADFWWVVGRYFGDGSLSVSKCTVDISCNAKESETLEVSEVLDRLGVKYSVYTKSTCNHISIHSKEWCEFLFKFGVGAENKQITPDILNLPKDLLSSFVDGYLSADGHIEHHENSVDSCVVTSISRNLMYGMQLCLLKSKGVYASLTTRKSQNSEICGRSVNTHKAYILSFYLSKREVGCKYVIENNICWVNISSVKKLPGTQTTVYNFSVEDDESYTANNVIVHNCSSYSVAALGKHRKKNPITKNLDPQTEYARFCDEVNAHFVELIKELNPKLYFIENPRGGMRKMSFMQGLPRYTVTYCKYTTDLPLEQRRMKPTDWWTNHPDPKFIPPCKNGDPCHVSAPRGARTGTQGIKGWKDRSRIPDALCDHIVEICEEYIMESGL